MNPVIIISILTVLVVLFGTLAISAYIYAFYSHDKELSFPGSRFIIGSIILSIFFSLNSILLLPIDFLTGDPFLNRNSIGIDINSLIILDNYTLISIALVISNFFWRKYYTYHNPYNEDKNDIELKQRIKTSLIYVGKILGVVLALLVPMSLFWGARVSTGYLVNTSPPSILKFSEIQSHVSANKINVSNYIVKFVPSLNIALSGPFIFMGYIIFYTFGFFGLATVPLFFWTMWIRRPKAPEAEHMVMGEMILREMTEESIETLKDLIETQEEIEETRKEFDHDKKALNLKIDTLHSEIIKVQKNLVLFEETYELKKKNHNILDENPLKYLSALIMGFVTAAFSILLVTSSIMSFIYQTSPLEKIFFFMSHFNTFYPLLFYLVLSFYCFYAINKGYDVLCNLYPNILGYNQMYPGRTWLDTWLMIACFLIPASLCISSFFLSICPNYFAFTGINRRYKRFIFNIEYIKIFGKTGMFKAISLFSFGLGIIMNFSKGIKKDILTQRIEETKNNLKNNQLKFKKGERGKSISSKRTSIMGRRSSMIR
jgi:ABC-type multidrug transport system fused ATPase/permease subunit